jgi:hypothetical protein
LIQPARLLAPLALLAAVPAHAGTLYQVGPTKPFQTLQAVAPLLTPGDEVEVDGDVTYPGGILFQNHGSVAQKITIRGLRVNGNRPRISGGGDGIKLDADHYVLEGLDITGDAGLPTNRCLFLQGDDILVRDTVVHDCPRHGILGADGESGTVTLEHVEVHHCGSGTQYHQVYMATDNTMFSQATFRLRFSWIHDANGGNSVKSRAGRNEIHYNWIEGAMFHELDLIGADGQPAGLVREDSEVVGNVLVKSPASSGRIARIGGDGTGDSSGRFRFAHNTMLLGAGSGTAIAIQDHVESLQVSDNAIYRTGGAAFTVVRTVEQVGTSLHAGQNNWIPANATGARPEWTGTLTGTTPGFTDLAGWNLTPLAGSAIHDSGLLPTSGPGGAPFPNPIAAPLYHPPARTVGTPGSEQPRPGGGTIDIGAYERVSVVPSMTIDDVVVTEGDAGNVPATFTVRLSSAATQSVTVGFATANGTATSPADYGAAAGILTFAAGATTRTVSVTVNGDTAVEPDETFSVDLSSVSGATLADGQGIGTISDDDAPPLSGLELRHGSRSTSDLAGGPDTYRLAQSPRASYEVIVDAASGDAAPTVVERLAADLSTVLQTAVTVGTGTSRSLRWQNTSASGIANQAIRVRSGGCTTDCGAGDTYRVRAWDTTYAVPRFNNGGSQVTVLLVQNATSRPVAGTAFFWSGPGTLLGSHPFNLQPRAALVLNAGIVAGTAGQGGSVTVTHDGGYGALAGKAVALEPATGYSFDSLMAPRPR